MKHYRVRQLVVSGLAATAVVATATHANESPTADMDVATAESTTTVNNLNADADRNDQVSMTDLTHLTNQQIADLYVNIESSERRVVVMDEMRRRKNADEDAIFVPQEEANRFGVGGVNHRDTNDMPELEDVRVVPTHIATARDEEQDAPQASPPRESDPREKRRDTRRTSNIGSAYQQ